jgi:hypothetical protein
MTDKNPGRSIRSITDLSAPEVYASVARGFSIDGGNIKITFSSYRTEFSEDGPDAADVEVLRLVLPLNGANSLASGLYSFLSDQGMLPDKPEDAN